LEWVDGLPTANALLNLTSACLLVIGYGFIRNRRVAQHRLCMLGALVASTLFLAGYLTYHYHHGTTKFTGEGTVRAVYFTVLITHTVLAAVVAPMALLTVFLAFRERFERHRRLARWTLPVWLYVSVTGVVIYLFLYVWYPARASS
jgi:putative membrane protein